MLQRLLLGKNLLVGKSGQLTTNSTPVAVAQVILTAHDAAELILRENARITSATTGVWSRWNQLPSMEKPVRFVFRVKAKGK